MMLRFLVAFPLVLSFMAVTALGGSGASPAPADACAPGTARLASYHFIVDGVERDQLNGHVEEGGNFTLVGAVAQCEGPTTTFALGLVVPGCDSAIRAPILKVLEGLAAGNETDPLELALINDVKATMACQSLQVQSLLPAALVVIAVAATSVAGMFVVRHRWKKGGPRS